MKAKEVKKLFAISTLSLSIASMGMEACGVYGVMETYNETQNFEVKNEESIFEYE